jgi:hypothetical protein
MTKYSQIFGILIDRVMTKWIPPSAQPVTRNLCLATASLAAWMILCLWTWPFANPVTRTDELIQSTDALIQTHIRAWGEAPASLNELRLFAKQTYSPYSAFDMWGQRLDYLRLGIVNYAVRSFGADGVQNRPGGALDPGVSRWGPLEERGLRYNTEAAPLQARPSVVLFAGADDHSGRWHAKIHVDPGSGARRLLARDRQDVRFYMMAAHDGVEEFFWVPGRLKIVFTATQSARYADGVYLWDLQTDDVINLVDIRSDGSGINPARQERRLHVALSAIIEDATPVVSVFMVDAAQGALDPKDFFQRKNIHEFSLGAVPAHTYSPVLANKQADVAGGFHTLDFLGTLTVSPQGVGNPQQVAWLRLPMGGDWEKAVIKWQEFAAAYGRTPLAPYAVWGLSMFYSEASKQSGLDSKQSRVLTSYSLELARALVAMPSAPGYVRAIGAWTMAHP